MKRFLLIALQLLGFNYLFSQCATTSVLGGHIIYNDITSSPVTWNNLAGAENSDNSRTTSGLLVTTNNTVNTSSLWAQTFLFSVPSNAIICGVEVQIERRQVGVVIGTSIVKDQSVRLINNMTVTGTEHAKPTAWSTTDQVEIYGGVGDLWGLSLTPAIINAPDFGVAMSATLQNTGVAIPLSAQVDKISILVYYTFPLPVELLSFDAIAQNRNVDLSWRTASETNNDYFIVERSSDAINWTSIATIPGNGTSNIENAYYLTDPNTPDGTLYYNLSQVDHNGHREHLGSKSVTVNTGKTPDLFYDPSTSTIQISGIDPLDECVLTILDISGNEIFHGITHGDPTGIQLNDMPKTGLYLFRLTVGDTTIVKKIMLG